jgi:diguanylate cyclase (GGDEF)-like protein
LIGRLRTLSLGLLLAAVGLVTASVVLLDLLALDPYVAGRQEADLQAQVATLENQTTWAVQAEVQRLQAICGCLDVAGHATTDVGWAALVRQFEGLTDVDAAWSCGPAGQDVRVWTRQPGKIVVADLRKALAGGGGCTNPSGGPASGSSAPNIPADSGLLRVDGQVLLFAARPAAVGARAPMVGLSLARRVDGTRLDRLALGTAADTALVEADHMPEGTAAGACGQWRLWPLGPDRYAAAWPAQGSSGALVGYFQADFSAVQARIRAQALHRAILLVLWLSAGAVLLVVLAADIIFASPIALLHQRLQKLISGDSRLEELPDGLHAEARTLARELQLAFQAISRLSNTDAMTGLANRRSFDEALEREFQQSRRYDRALSVLMLDIDLFKAINDTKGHATGDEVLKIAAGLVKRCCRAVDIPARMGGDEFAVLLPETAACDAGVVAERIRKAVAEKTYNIEGSEIGLTVSIGVADIHSGRMEKPEDFLALADEALYAAKQLGRNRFVQANEPRQDAWGDVHADEQQRVLMLRAKLTGLDTQFKSLFVRALQEIVHVMERRDPLMADHARKVQRYSAMIGKHLNLSEDLIKQIEMAALLHDIGMLALPDAVALCPGRLNEQQLEIMQRHPMIGAQILDGAEFLEQVIPIIRFHHERFDGKGYPEGLSGLGIPPICRVVAVGDAFDAMTSRRAFRDGMTTEQAICELRKGSGAQFDPEMVEAFVAVAEQLGDKLTNLSLCQAGTAAAQAPADPAHQPEPAHLA